MFSPQQQTTSLSTKKILEVPTRRLRQACDACHRAKTKCCGSRPCTGCQRSGNPCVYSQSNRVGRPKGTRNKKSLDLSLKQQSAAQQQKSRQNSTDRSSTWQSATNNNTTHNYDSESSANGDMTSSNYEERRPRLSSTASASSTTSIPAPVQDFSQPSTGTSMSFDFESDSSNFAAYPNVFLGPPVTPYQNFSFPLMTPDLCMDSMSMDFHSDPSLGDLQYNFGMPTSLETCTDGFNWSLPVTAPMPEDSMMQQEHLELKNMVSVTTTACDTASSPEEPPSAMMPPSTLPLRGIKRARTHQPPQAPCLIIPDDVSTISLYSPLKTPISIAPLDDSKCHCLHHHAKLLVRLQDLWKGLGPAPIDVVLNGVQQAMKSWDHYIQCQVCQLDDEQEVLLLSAMSIRGVLRLLQNTLPRMPSKSKRSSGETKFSVGTFELKGEERLLVLELVLSQILTKIQTVLACLKAKFSSFPEKTFQGRQDIDGLTNLDYLQTLLHSLDKSVQHLSTDLMNQRQ